MPVLQDVVVEDNSDVCLDHVAHFIFLFSLSVPFSLFLYWEFKSRIFKYKWWKGQAEERIGKGDSSYE